MAKNRNKWATDAIGKEWCDKDYMIVNFFSALVIDFVEGEEAFETVWWGNLKEISHDPCEQEREALEECSPSLLEYRKTIEAAYEHFKHFRPKLLKKIEDEEMYLFSKSNISRDQTIISALENELIRRNTKHIKAIVEIRGCLWT